MPSWGEFGLSPLMGGELAPVKGCSVVCVKWAIPELEILQRCRESPFPSTVRAPGAGPSPQRCSGPLLKADTLVAALPFLLKVPVAFFPKGP